MANKAFFVNGGITPETSFFNEKHPREPYQYPNVS